MTNTTTLFYDLIAQSAAAVMVFCDGVRAVLNTDYTVDHFDRSVTVNLLRNGVPVQDVMIHPFGFGGTAPIDKQYLSYGTDALTLPVPTAADNLAVIVNGALLAPTEYSFDGTTVRLTPPPSTGSDVALLVYDTDAASATTMQMQTWTYSSGSTFPLTYPDTETVPPHAGTLVEVNGVRLTPPTTFYGTINCDPNSDGNAWMYLPVMPSPSAVTVMYLASAAPATGRASGISTAPAAAPAARASGTATAQAIGLPQNGVSRGRASGTSSANAAAQTWVVYQAAIPLCTATDIRDFDELGFDVDNFDISTPYPFNLVLPDGVSLPHTPGQFVLFDNMLVALDQTFASSSVIVVLTDVAADYTVPSAQQLVINKTLTPGDRVAVTTFSHAGCMGIQTVTYWDTSGQYLIPTPQTSDYAHVTMNGYAQAPDGDYNIYAVPASNNHISFMATSVMLTAAVTGPVVATVFTGRAATDRTEYRVSTTTGAVDRMVPHSSLYGFDQYGMGRGGFDDDTVVPDGWDGARLDTLPYDLAHPYPPFNPAAIYSIADKFEYLRMSPYMAGTLATDLGSDDASIIINLFLQPLAAILQDANPLPIPTPTQCGVIWLEDERIEYFGYSRVQDVVTLTALRRATRGTSMGSQRLVQTGTGTGTPQLFNFTGSGTVDVSVDGIGQPPAMFTVTVAPTGVAVTVTAPSGAYIVIGVSITATHQAGAPVWNGQQVVSADPSAPVEVLTVSDFGITAADGGVRVATTVGHTSGSSTARGLGVSGHVSSASASGLASAHAIG